MGIGTKLQTLLNEKNVSVAELAKLINVAPTTIYSIIQRNNKKVDIDVLLNISDVLGVNAEYFRDTSSNSSSSTPFHLNGDIFINGLDLNKDEVALIIEYRKTDSATKTVIDRLLGYQSQITDLNNRNKKS